MQPDLRILKYPPGRFLNLGPKSSNSFLTNFLLLIFEYASLRLINESVLASVINGSANLLSSLALGTEVSILSNSIAQTRNQTSMLKALNFPFFLTGILPPTT